MQVMGADIWLTFPDGTEHELEHSVSVGRDRSNDLVLESSAVSRDHAGLMFRDGRWYIEDRGSFNGTFLNGTRVVPGTPLPLRHADRISIGTETLIFSWPAQPEDPDTTEPLSEVAGADGAQLSSFQRQVVQRPLQSRQTTRLDLIKAGEPFRLPRDPLRTSQEA